MTVSISRTTARLMMRRSVKLSKLSTAPRNRNAIAIISRYRKKRSAPPMQDESSGLPVKYGFLLTGLGAAVFFFVSDMVFPHLS